MCPVRGPVDDVEDGEEDGHGHEEEAVDVDVVLAAYLAVARRVALAPEGGEVHVPLPLGLPRLYLHDLHGVLAVVHAVDARVALIAVVCACATRRRRSVIPDGASDEAANRLRRRPQVDAAAAGFGVVSAVVGRDDDGGLRVLAGDADVVGDVG